MCSLLVTLAMACLTFAAIMGLLLLWVLVGRERATSRIEWMVQSLLEWLSGEGRHRARQGLWSRR